MGVDGRTTRLSDRDLRLLSSAPGEDSATVLVSTADGPRSAALRPGRAVVVGRDAPSNLLVDDASLSRRHALFELRDGAVWVEDLGSTNGTRVNGVAVEAAARVEPGDEVLMGSVAATVHARLTENDARERAVGGHDRFFLLLSYEVDRAREAKDSAALLMIESTLDGSDARAGAGDWIEAVTAGLRRVDRVGIYSRETIELLLPGVGPERVEALARRLCAAAPRAALRCAAACFPASATSADALVQACRTALARHRDLPPERARREPLCVAPDVGAAAPVARSAGDEGPLVASAAMREVFETVDRVADSSIGVLILGETGTGKELVARALHERSSRAAQPLCSLNCAAIPGQLVESALFGHERGAFTGASQARAGVFEAADGGTVFLDEVGELSADAQAALLRALEIKRISRVGSTAEIAVDVRVVAATHRDLEALCAAGSFRRDLLFRLNSVILQLPPLRERPEAIEPLCARFIRAAASDNRRDVRGIDADAMRALRRYAWPGNVRELRNAIERAVVITRGERVGLDDLPEQVRALGEDSAAADASGAATDASAAVTDASGAALLDGDVDFRDRLKAYERDLIARALSLCGYNQSETARRLRIPLRTLINKIEQYGLRRR